MVTQYELEDFKKTLESSLAGCEWWGIRDYREGTQFRMARNGKVAQNSTNLDQGLMVEVMIDGQIGYGATNDTTNEGVKRACAKALEMAKATAMNPLTNFDLKARPTSTGEYQSSFQKPLTELDAALVSERLIDVSKLLGDDSAVIEAGAWAMITDTHINYMTSNGSRWSQNFGMVTKDMYANGKKDDLIQKRSLGMAGRQWGAESLDEGELKASAQRILKELHELLNAPDCPSEKMDLILSPDQLYLQVHESIGHPLELDRILGDERNYAGWSFVAPEDFGSLKYGPEILNVTFDPTLEGEMASFKFDDTGVPATKEYLIEKGLLKRGIGGIESQLRSGLEGVSTMRATSWNRAPIDRMGNINIEPGESTMDEMIKSTENGVLMQTNRSWSIDDYRNKFQFGCEYGQLIKDGEIKGVVKNPNYRSSTVPFWNSLSHVGNKETFEIWGSPYCGKGEPNQIIRVGHAIPTCKFTDIDVFGGA
ncbi:MAG: TldD/PmbA family protein [Bacteriovoracaceae bacterium]